MASASAIELLPDPEALARRAAAFVAEQARAAVADHGQFTFAVSGGQTPWKMFAHLAEHELPWGQTLIFQVDERVAKAGDPDRNLTHLLKSLPEHADSEIHAMPVEEDDLQAAAVRYERTLPKHFDLVHLGLGTDGHTASLVPGDPVLDVSDRDVAVTLPYMGHRRMTLTYRVLNRAHLLLWLVTGADKAQALRRMRASDDSIPAGHVNRERALIFADLAAGEQ
ncbi:MAG: 6-phosphogluconolactonase [Solirubrobacteraceae bacterium]